ncbi:MAG: lytic murein transglycosylase [Xanthobacteraceae bacterium]
MPTRAIDAIRGSVRLAVLTTPCVVMLATSGLAQPNCRNTGAFEPWLAAFKKEALAKGIAPSALAAAGPYLVLDQRIINIDRGQRFFAQNFIEMSDKMVVRSGRLSTGARQLKKYEALFEREMKDYGVPASVINAFWGLESDFGAGQGKDHSITSLATLGYDCRRSDMFRAHLFDALRIIEHGDLRADEMIGSWAGELGQTQMMPSEYMAHAVDYDGDGRRDLIKSAADVIGSTGKYLVHLGWKRGEPWLQEIRVPPNLPWKEADLSVQHPRSQWASWGVTLANGKPLPNDQMPASVVLPVGRFGPAFLAYDNFQAYLKWNNSLNYSLTAAYYATRLDGAPAMSRGSGTIPHISFDDARQLQELLQKRGYDVGRLDGVLGLKTREAIRDMQIKLAMPADGWPTPELLTRMGGTVRASTEQAQSVSPQPPSKAGKGSKAEPRRSAEPFNPFNPR